MAYTPQVWSNGSSGGTPLNAARLNVLEAGVASAADPTQVGNTVAQQIVSNSSLQAAGDARWGDPASLTPVAVFFGDSHTTPTGTTFHWPVQLATNMGENWTVKNFAVAGAGYTVTGNTFASQFTAANAGLTADEKTRVRHVFVASCGNDALAAASSATFTTAANALFANIKDAYPRAQVHCIPAFYGSNGDNLGVTRRGHLSRLVNILRDLSVTAGISYVEGTWSWTWGRSDLMDPNDIHYNAAGKTWLARWVEQYLRGGTTWRDIPRTPLVTYSNSYAGYSGGGWQPLSWWMNRGTIYLNGAFNKGSAWTANAIGNLPVEARPVENAQGIGCEVFITGDIMNRQTGSGAGTLSASWPMF